MPYSRDNPSPRYRELMAMYRAMHIEGDVAHGIPAEKTFAGISLPRQAHRIRSLIARTGARTVLDYGCGKGTQYRPMPIKQGDVVRWNSIQEYWGVESIRCYDPGYTPFAELPQGKFDGVVCTDVLEHCPGDDLDWIVDGLFGYANRFVFANVACYPAKKTLPNGENAHCTIRPGSFWRALLETSAARHPGVLWEVWIEENRGAPDERLANFDLPQPAQPARPGPAVWRMV
jgi:hypothetical protein